MVKIVHRSTEASKVQEFLTQFGGSIKVRLGFHEVSKEFCANDGLVILEVDGDPNELGNMLEALNKVNYVQAKMIEM